MKITQTLNVIFRNENILHQNNTSLEELGSKTNCKKKFEGTQTGWKKFHRPAIDATALVIGIALAEKSKKPRVGQATANHLISVSERKDFITHRHA